MLAWSRANMSKYWWRSPIKSPIYPTINHSKNYFYFLGKTVFSRTKNSEKLDLRILKLPLVPFWSCFCPPRQSNSTMGIVKTSTLTSPIFVIPIYLLFEKPRGGSKSRSATTIFLFVHSSWILNRYEKISIFVHIVWKLLNMSRLNFSTCLAFLINFPLFKL